MAQAAFFLAALLLTTAQGEAGQGQVIGSYIAVEGTVLATHRAEPHPQPVRLNDEVLFQDTIETGPASRTKAFFLDDTILTLGESSRVSINQHIYKPDQSLRRVIVNLLMGEVRALVGKAFKGSGSRFEVHTPTAVAAARGTYFIVWSNDQASGVVNIGEAGLVDFSSGGRTVTLAPGQFSHAPAGGPPVQPRIFRSAGTSTSDTAATKTSAKSAGGESRGNERGTHRQDGEHARALQAIEGTTVKEARRGDSPRDVVRSLGLAGSEDLAATPGLNSATPSQAMPAAIRTLPSQGVGILAGTTSAPQVPVAPPAAISRTAPALIPVRPAVRHSSPGITTDATKPLKKIPIP